MTVNFPLLLGCLIPSLILAYTDAKQRILPDKLTYAIFFAGLVNAVHGNTILPALEGMLLAFIITFIPFCLGLSGGGDVKLAAGLGLWFGFQDTFYLLLLASVIGIVWGITNLVKNGRFGSWVKASAVSLSLLFVPKTDKTAVLLADRTITVPFGTCLVSAGWLIWVVTGVINK